jgi:hypothetical protein
MVGDYVMAFDPVTAIFGIGEKLLDRLWPDPATKADALQKMNEMRQKGDLAFLDAEVKLMTGQLEINKMEAMHGGWFKGGWRPAVGWICAIALAYKFVIQPFLVFIVQTVSYSTGNELFPLEHLPELAWSELSVILLGMLGIGAQRSIEKLRTTRSDK